MSRREEQKQQRRIAVIRAAYALFTEIGIEGTTMQAVANRAGIGIASVYRYFDNKAVLAVEAASMQWSETMDLLLKRVPDEGSGLEQLKTYLEGFVALFRRTPDFFRFFENFDNYIIGLTQKPENMSAYEDVLTTHNLGIGTFLEKGLKDGSIRTDRNLTELFPVYSQAIMGYAQKLIVRGRIVKTDEGDPVKRFQSFIAIMIHYIEG